MKISMEGRISHNKVSPFATPTSSLGASTATKKVFVGTVQRRRRYEDVM